MKNLALFSIFLICNTSIYTQNHVGRNVQDVAKAYDSYYTFKNNSSDLFRTIFIKKDDMADFFVYTYSDKSGNIKIQLDTKLLYGGAHWDEIDTSNDYSSFDFHENMASVIDVNTGKSGFIDNTGKIIITPQYTTVGEFSEGLAYFTTVERCNGAEVISYKTGYIDSKGTKIIDLPKELSGLYGCCYFSGGAFKNGIAIMRVREHSFDCNSSMTIVIDKTGKILNYEGRLLDPNYKPIDIEQFSK